MEFNFSLVSFCVHIFAVISSIYCSIAAPYFIDFPNHQFGHGSSTKYRASTPAPNFNNYYEHRPQSHQQSYINIKRFDKSNEKESSSLPWRGSSFGMSLQKSDKGKSTAHGSKKKSSSERKRLRNSASTGTITTVKLNSSIPLSLVKPFEAWKDEISLTHQNTSSRYATRFGKDMLSKRWATHPNHNPHYPGTTYQPSHSQSQQYHWQNLPPVGHYPHHQHQSHYGPSNSLNFGFGTSASAHAAAAAASAVSSHFPGTTTPTTAHSPGSTEKGTSNRKHSPGHYYSPAHNSDQNRKRFRLEIHPGLIAAPLAGLAAYKAVSAFSMNPILLELGLVKRSGKGDAHHHHKPPPNYPTPAPHHHHYHHHYSHYDTTTTTTTTTRRPYHHYHTYLPNNNHHPWNYPTSTSFPILLPPSHPHDFETPKPGGPIGKPWWSPFAAIIPRFRSMESPSHRNTSISIDDTPMTHRTLD